MIGTFYQGSVIPFSQTFLHANGTLVNPSSPQVVLIDSSNVITLIPLVQIQNPGVYATTWTVPQGATVGTWTFYYSGFFDGQTWPSDSDNFEVGSGTAGPPTVTPFTYAQRIDQIAQVDYNIFKTSTVTDGTTVRNGCFNDALNQYSRLRPRHLMVQYPAAGGPIFEYDLTLLVPVGANNSTLQWQEDIFEVERIIYPFGVYFAYQRNEIDAKFYQTYKKPDGHQYLMFFSTIPAAGLNIGLYYTTIHTITESFDSLQAERPTDFDSFCRLTASKVLEAAANTMAAFSKSALPSDTQDYQNKSSNYAKRSQEAEKRALDFLGSEDKVTGMRLVWDLVSYGGTDHIFKRRVWS